MSYPTFAALQGGYTRLWANLTPRPERVPALQAICGRLTALKAVYAGIANTVWGKPEAWFIPALIDQMEHDPERGLCNSHLHNGDSLAHRTVEVPAGRPPPPAAPPFTFAQSAVDALRLEGLDQVVSWTIERLAYWLERYNGEGYLDKPIENPYLASWSNLYTAGKYTSDHHYDPEAVSQQPGALVILKILIEQDQTIAAALAPAQPKESTPMTTTQTAPAAPNVLSEIEQALQAANVWLPQVLQWAGMFFPPAAALAKFLPLIQIVIQAVQTIQQATGQNTVNATTAVINHLTPGQTNAPTLN